MIRDLAHEISEGLILKGEVFAEEKRGRRHQGQGLSIDGYHPPRGKEDGEKEKEGSGAILSSLNFSPWLI